MSAVHKLDLPPRSQYTPEQRAEILNEARANAAAPLPEVNRDVRINREDPVQKWKREADEREAEMRIERRQAIDVEQRRLRRQQQRQADTSAQWSSYIAREVRTAIENERNTMTEIIGGVIAEERRRMTKAFESRIAELETKHAKQIAELAMTIARQR